MKNEEYYILLNRFTSLKINKEDVEDYLKECEKFNEDPTSLGFLSYIDSLCGFDSFSEEIEDTAIEDSTQFYKLIQEIKRND